MSDWRTWARVIGALVIAAVVFGVFMNMIGDYRTAKQRQRLKASSEPAGSLPSTVTQTGRPPLSSTATKTTGAGKTSATQTGTRLVIVLVDGVNLRTAPLTTSSIIRGLDRNERLTYLGQRNGYYRVRDKEGREGWVSANRNYTRLTPAR